MNKQELVDALSRETKLPKGELERVLQAFMRIITEELRQDRDITLMGFGSFSLGRRKGRKGYNPHTGEPLEIPEMRLPKFRAGKALKEALNSSN